VRRFWIPAVVVAFAFALAAGGRAGGTRAHCAQALPHGPSLPAPIVVTTRCGRFRLQPSGDVVFKGRRTSPVPKGASYFMDLTWYRFSRRHLLIGRGMKQLWRSHQRYPATYPGNVGRIALGRRSLSFSYFRSLSQKKPRLYVARYAGPERLVASGEDPVAVMSGRLLTWRSDRALVLRATDGRFERVAAPHAIDPQWNRDGGRVVFRFGHQLRVFDGRRVRKLANRYALGVRGAPVVELLGRLVSVHDTRRVVVLDYRGRIVAASPLPKRQQRADGVSSSVVSNAAATAFAFTATNRARGVDTVYVLVAGTTRALARFDVKTDFNGCGYMASLAWRGPWLLYSNADPGAAVVDARGHAPAVDLNDVISRLPGVERDGPFNIAWAPAP
jgi:hypothetical protein